MKISHREYCLSVASSAGDGGSVDPITNHRREYQADKLPLNPGDGRTFPWLAGIAERFEKYKFTKLRFIYHPTCSTLKDGGIALCPIYDPADSLPTSPIMLLNAEGVVRGAVHNELSLNVPANRLRKNETMFVRSTHEALVDENELRMSDLGFLAVSLSDEQLSTKFGDIFVEYEIELHSPRIGPRIGQCAHFKRESYNTFGSDIAGCCAPFGTGITAQDRSYHSPANTVMFDVETLLAKYTRDALPVDVNRITFREPFTGLLHYMHDGPDNGTSGASSSLVINGVGEPGISAHWEANIGNTDPPRSQNWGIVESINAISGAAGTLSQVFKIACEAGDTLDMAFAGGGTDFMASAEMLLSDAAPALLALL